MNQDQLKNYICDLLDYSELIEEEEFDTGEGFIDHYDDVRCQHYTEDCEDIKTKLTFRWDGKEYIGVGDWYGTAKKDLICELEKAKILDELVNRLGGE